MQITMYANVGDARRSEVAAKFVLEGEGHANEGSTLAAGVLHQMCTDFDDTLFSALVKD